MLPEMSLTLRHFVSTSAFVRRWLTHSGTVAIAISIGVLTVTIPNHSLGAEAGPVNLSSILTDMIARTAGLPENPALSAHALSPTIIVPNWQESDKSFSEVLSRFDRVPDQEGHLETKDSIVNILRSLSDDIELGKREPTSSDLERLEAAQALLYSDSESKTPTSIYQQYLAFEKQNNELQDKLAQETNEAAKIGLRGEIDIVEQNWEIFGRRTEIDGAIEIVSALSVGTGDELYKSWLEALSNGQSLDPKDISLTLAAPNWIHLSFTPDIVALQDNSASFGSSEESLGLGGTLQLESISLDFVRFKIRRRVLDHPFVAETSWRVATGKMLSDGDGSATDTKSEVIPRVVDELILVKNIELRFADDLPLRIRDALRKQSTAVISGVVLADALHPMLSYQPRYVATSQPFVIALVVRDLPRIPNPAPGQTWSKP